MMVSSVGEMEHQETHDANGSRNAPTPWGRVLVQRALALAMILLCWLMTPAALPAQIPPPPGTPTQSVPLPHPDIASPDFPSRMFTPWWLVVSGIVVGLLLVAALVWFALLPKRHRPPSLRNAPLKTAIESLEALRTRVHEMSPSEVAHDVSLIIRMYLQQSYAVPAPYRTTEELYHSAALDTRVPLKNRFEPVSVFYDQVEFAPRPRTVADSEALVETALEALREEQKLMAQPAFVIPTSGPPPLPPMPSPSAPAAEQPAEDAVPSSTAAPESASPSPGPKSETLRPLPTE
ncbi:hypothetical protein [Roseimicrobium sp. ORNL1]|uniref:hypothetical protein n=1 Tax=Roseimicrobium sp. ORNL1 TaxID=2711231 RepID=UPI0013E10AF3|nr:hypothetical protein [Roseimicrobium sp. ORNL1]QIF02143.1 hypothetical protein G5S37_11560 [Roseimicrobium sp. ORNL1]